MSNLILARKCGEAIHIGDDVVITVLTITDGRVRLGIEAPQDVSVHRQEIYEVIQRRKAAQIPEADVAHDCTNLRRKRVARQ